MSHPNAKELGEAMRPFILAGIYIALAYPAMPGICIIIGIIIVLIRGVV